MPTAPRVRHRRHHGRRPVDPAGWRCGAGRRCDAGNPDAEDGAGERKRGRRRGRRTVAQGRPVGARCADRRLARPALVARGEGPDARPQLYRRGARQPGRRRRSLGDLRRPPRYDPRSRSRKGGGLGRRHVPRRCVPDPRPRAVAELSQQQPADRQRHRGVARHKALDLWLQQTLFDDLVSVRAGQIAVDDEFFISQYAAHFINATFGWPEFMGVNALSGGPVYPLATPGARITLTPSRQLSFSAAVFNGDPAGRGPGNPQERDASGTSFRLGDGAFSIAEAAYARNQEKEAAGLPATYKLGGYYYTGPFGDPRQDDTRRPLADPASSGRPAIRHTHFGFYLVADQMVWRRAGTTDRGLGLFARLAGSQTPRNHTT